MLIQQLAVQRCGNFSKRHLTSSITSIQKTVQAAKNVGHWRPPRLQEGQIESTERVPKHVENNKQPPRNRELGAILFFYLQIFHLFCRILQSYLTFGLCYEGNIKKIFVNLCLCFVFLVICLDSQPSHAKIHRNCTLTYVLSLSKRTKIKLNIP